MELSAIKERQDELAEGISRMLNAFREETGVDIVDIDVKYIKTEVAGSKPSYRLCRVIVSLTL